MIEADLIAMIAGAEGISDLIGDRIFPHRVAQTAIRPLIVFECKGRKQEYTQNGESTYQEAEISLEIQADSYLTAKQVAAAVKLFLSGYSGTQGESQIHFIEYTDESENFDTDPSGADTGYIKVQQDYRVRFS